MFTHLLSLFPLFLNQLHPFLSDAFLQDEEKASKSERERERYFKDSCCPRGSSTAVTGHAGGKQKEETWHNTPKGPRAEDECEQRLSVMRGG